MVDHAEHLTQDDHCLRPIRLGGVTLQSPVVFAPMSGVTDRPFRRIVRKFGAELVVTEMLASKAVVREHRKTQRMLEREGNEGLLAVQLAGREPEIMTEAARLAEDRGADIIDLNFGCPVKKVVKDLIGAAQMRDEAHAAKIFEAVVKPVKVPVALKQRLSSGAFSALGSTLKAPRRANSTRARNAVQPTSGRTQFHGGPRLSFRKPVEIVSTHLHEGRLLAVTLEGETHPTGRAIRRREMSSESRLDFLMVSNRHQHLVFHPALTLRVFGARRTLQKDVAPSRLIPAELSEVMRVLIVIVSGANEPVKKPLVVQHYGLLQVI